MLKTFIHDMIHMTEGEKLIEYWWLWLLVFFIFFLYLTLKGRE